MTEPLPTCAFCGLTVYLDGRRTHPCCDQAKARGERRCFGCSTMPQRDAAWEAAQRRAARAAVESR